jgi:hypothetical protein
VGDRDDGLAGHQVGQRRAIVAGLAFPSPTAQCSHHYVPQVCLAILFAQAHACRRACHRFVHTRDSTRILFTGRLKLARNLPLPESGAHHAAQERLPDGRVPPSLSRDAMRKTT